MSLISLGVESLGGSLLNLGLRVVSLGMSTNPRDNKTRRAFAGGLVQTLV
jgi:hypothetical protein